MNAENGVLLWSIPQGCNMKEGLEYDDMISCTEVVSVSASYSKCSLLMFSLCSMTYQPHRLLIVSLCTLCIYSVDTILYPYALPLITSLFLFSSLCLSATWALRVKIITITSISSIYMLGKTAWYITQDEYRFFVSFIFTNLLCSYSCSLTYSRYIIIKQ